MVETAAVALRLLELIALLFPVVALLLQLQHRAVDSSNRVAFGGMVGTGLTGLLSLSFVTVALYLVTALEPSSLLAASIAVIAFTALLVPVLVVLSLGRPVDLLLNFASSARTMIRTVASQTRQFCRRIYQRWK